MVVWVFVDLGGTLLDEGPEHAFLHETLAQLLADHGVRTTAALLRAREAVLIRHHVHRFVRVLIEESVRDPGAAADIRRELARRFEALTGELQPLFPGALRALDDLRRDYRVGILANQPAAMHPYLDATGISGRADIVLLSGEVGVGKPSLAFFRRALDAAAVPPAEVAMVGDRIDNDVAPAKALGMRTVRVRSAVYALQEPGHAAERPDVEVRRIDEVPEAVRSL